MTEGKKLAPEVIQGMREAKKQGMSLSMVAAKFHVCTASVSTYCRDLFQTNGKRVYSSEAELRDAAKNRESKKKRQMHPCLVCGKPIRMAQKHCLECYKKSLEEYRQKKAKKEARAHSQTPRKAVLHLPHGRYVDTMSLNGGANPKPPVIVRHKGEHVKMDPCPNSPTKAHHWVLDYNGNGPCKYCSSKHIAVDRLNAKAKAGGMQK